VGEGAGQGLKAKKVAVMVELIEKNGVDLLDGEHAQKWNADPESHRAALVALLGLFKKPVPSALAAPPELKLDARTEARIALERQRMPKVGVAKPIKHDPHKFVHLATKTRKAKPARPTKKAKPARRGRKAKKT
jgi:hypothetical protein